MSTYKVTQRLEREVVIELDSDKPTYNQLWWAMSGDQLDESAFSINWIEEEVRDENGEVVKLD